MPPDFKKYLLQKAVIDKKYVPFNLKWVSEFYSFLNEADAKTFTLEQKQSFLTRLSKTHEDWQVKQAGQCPSDIQLFPLFPAKKFLGNSTVCQRRMGFT